MTRPTLRFRPIDVWPGELTRVRRTSPFSASWSSTKGTLLHEAEELGAKEVVLQIAVPDHAIRQDGQIRSGAKGPEHPGVIISMDTDRGSLRFSTDRFTGASWKPDTHAAWHANARAVALALEALRKVDRYGVGSGREQYVGWGALPPATPMGSAMTVVEAAALIFPDDPAWILEVGTDRDVRAEYRARVRHSGAHPDVGGDPELFRRLTAARDLLLEEVKRRG